MKIQVPTVRREPVGVKLVMQYETVVEPKTIFDYDFQAIRRAKGTASLVFRVGMSVTVIPVVCTALLVYGCGRIVAEALIDAARDIAYELPPALADLHETVVDSYRRAVAEVMAR